MTPREEELKRRIKHLENELAEERRWLQAARTQLEVARAQLEATRTQLDSSNRHLHTLTNSAGFRLLERLRATVDRIAPWGTRRRGFFLAATRATYIALTEGRTGVISRVVGFRRWGSRFWLKAPLVPPALPVDEAYNLWLDKHRLSEADMDSMRVESEAFSYRPLISITTPVYNTDPEMLKAALGSVRGQIYDRWELCLVDDGSPNPATRAVLMKHVYLDSRIKVKFLGRNEGIVAASNAALSMATGQFVGLMDHDDELQPNALFEVVKLLNDNPKLDYLYTDEDKGETDGRRVQPFFKPGWSPDLLLSMNYLSHFSVVRTDLLRDVGGFRTGFDGSQDYDAALRITEKTDRIAHIALPLYTWRKVAGSAAESTEAKPYAYEAAKNALAGALRRRGRLATVMDGPVTGYYRVKYKISGLPKVAIIIPTRDQVDVLKRGIDTIREKTSYGNYEITIADNDSHDARALEYLSNFDGRVIQCAGEFNFSRINNLVAREVDAEMLLFLNNDTQVVSTEWLDAMIEHAQRTEVAAVGARLLYPDGRVQHEGVLVGCNRLACNIDHQGYFALGEVIHNVSAVTAACMMTRAEVFRELNGFDENLPVAFNDVDYCLRARERGYFVVYTPYAVLYHDEGGTRGRVHPVHDEIVFRARWANSPLYADPYYNPNFDLDHPFSLRL
jgi:O-antigen biosynthesis protein